MAGKETRTLTGVLVYVESRIRLAEIAAQRSASTGETVSLAEVVAELLEAP